MAARGDEGYATPAAALISIALAVVVAATTTRAVAELRLARADLERTQAEYALAAAQNAAMISISTSSRPPPYRWTQSSLGESIHILAEPERAKLSAAELANASDDTFRRLGVADAAALRLKLATLGNSPTLGWIADQAIAANWRACAPSLASPFGAATLPPALSYSEPRPGQQPSLWRAGEVWRIRVTNAAGWRDERIVRFTGNGLEPVAVIGRRLSRGGKGTENCEASFDGA